MGHFMGQGTVQVKLVRIILYRAIFISKIKVVIVMHINGEFQFSSNTIIIIVCYIRQVVGRSIIFKVYIHRFYRSTIFPEINGKGLIHQPHAVGEPLAVQGTGNSLLHVVTNIIGPIHRKSPDKRTALGVATIRCLFLRHNGLCGFGLFPASIKARNGARIIIV